MLKQTVAYSSFATETISNMSVQSTTPTAAPKAAKTSSPSTGKSKIPAGSSIWIGSTANTTFGMPAGITLPQFDKTGWANWSGILEVLLALLEAEDVFLIDKCPADVNEDDWSSIQRRTKAYLRLYIKQDIYSLIANDATLPSSKHKWDLLSATHGGTSGSTTIFNLWIQLTQAHLDDTSPMASQLAKLNEARVALSNANMGVTDIQFCLILLNTLPASYEVLASTILASGAPSALQHSKIITCILMRKATVPVGPPPLTRLGQPPSKAKAKAKARTTPALHAIIARRRGISSPTATN